jgi:hypothetical protein
MIYLSFESAKTSLYLILYLVIFGGHARVRLSAVLVACDCASAPASASVRVCACASTRTCARICARARASTPASARDRACNTRRASASASACANAPVRASANALASASARASSTCARGSCGTSDCSISFRVDCSGIERVVKLWGDLVSLIKRSAAGIPARHPVSCLEKQTLALRTLPPFCGSTSLPFITHVTHGTRNYTAIGYARPLSSGPPRIGALGLDTRYPILHRFSMSQLIRYWPCEIMFLAFLFLDGSSFRGGIDCIANLT